MGINRYLKPDLENRSSKIYIAGHQGMVGSAIWRYLRSKGYTNLIGKSSNKLDLRDQIQVERFFREEEPEYVFLAAAKVGGIYANNKYRGEFIYNNLQIQNNVIHQSYLHGVRKLLFLGSSCIYPKSCPQPMKEDYLLTGELEPTNEPYAIAKISGIKMCENYNIQYDTNFISAMPTNLYGPNDNYNLQMSHVLPALLRKFFIGQCLESNNWHGIISDLNQNPIDGISGKESEKKILQLLKRYGVSRDSKSLVTITIWGTGAPLREFLHVSDLAEACVYLMKNYNDNQFINVGSGKEISIKHLALLIKKTVGFQGNIKFDDSKHDGSKRKLLDISQLKKQGWKSKINIESGLKSVYDEYKRMINN